MKASSVNVGDIITPCPAWNASERHRQLNASRVVLGLQAAQCQSGILAQVRFTNGQTAWLDLGWFGFERG